MPYPQDEIKTALFVDFDNVYITLRNLDEFAAERFAIDPMRWIDWLARGMPVSCEQESEAGRGESRRLLMKRCYLNPRSFQKFRVYFTRAAVSVTDCPPLTEGGKTSSDIYMAMDILDTLQYRPHIQEFIILSADSDFMPVLLRLREFDRRTVGLSVGPTGAAYRSAFDHMIGPEEFIEHALGVTSHPGQDFYPFPERTSAVPEDVLDAVAEAVHDEASVYGEVPASDLPRIFKRFPEFRDSNWFGFYSLQALTDDLIRREPDLRRVEMAGGESWKVEFRAGGPADDTDYDSLRQSVAAQVKEIVRRSPNPTPLNMVASEIGDSVAGTRWAGAGSFRSLIDELELGDIEVIAPPNSPGYLMDPDQHSPPGPAWAGLDATAPFADYPAELSEFARRIHTVTDTPLLNPRQYGLVFRAIAGELRNSPFNFTAVSRAVRDRCLEWEEAIPRSAISFILRGIAYGGHDFTRYPLPEKPEVFAKAFRENVRKLIEFAQGELSSEDASLLDAWILGGLAEGELVRNGSAPPDNADADTDETRAS